MKDLRVLVLMVFYICSLSCNNDNTVVDVPTETEEPMDQEPPNEGENQMLGVVNAFPNLSFSEPLDLQATGIGSNKIYVAEKDGVIKAFENDPGVDVAEIFLDLGNISTTSEQGLMGFTFHPDFDSNGFLYVHYTPVSSMAFVSRFTVSAANGNMVDPDSEVVIIEIPQPQTNHNGGQLAFGPDGFLYIAVGDGGGAGDTSGNAQNRSNLLGTILRIDVDNVQGSLNYAVPGDNPFVNEPDFRSEIYAYGLRNPWRMSFDTQTGKLWTGDVGQNKIEEIDVIESGGNYGWNFFEGTDCFSGDCNTTGLIDPIFEYTQSNGDRSITGGYVYRGIESTSLQGKYIYGDFITGRIWALTEDGSTNDLIAESGLNISSFGTDSAQELYICAFDGSIYKFQEADN